MTGDTCKCHSGVKKGLSDAEQDIVELFKAVKQKTPLWAFLLAITILAGVIGSSLGLQWAIYQMMGVMSTKVAVVESRMLAIEKQGSAKWEGSER